MNACPGKDAVSSTVSACLFGLSGIFSVVPLPLYPNPPSPLIAIEVWTAPTSYPDFVLVSFLSVTNAIFPLSAISLIYP